MRKLDIPILPKSAWPAADQAAWTAALIDGGLFGQRSALAHYDAGRLKVMGAAYGRWLGFLKDILPREDIVSGLDHACDVQLLASFMEQLEVVAPYTARRYLTDLLTVCRAMRPTEPFRALHRAVRHLWRTARSMSDKHSRMVPARDLYRFGLQLMRQAPDRSTPLKRAGRYRDGLMIAMLAAAPVRIGNFLSVMIGDHLRWDGTCYRLCFRGTEVKNRRYIDATLPIELIPYIREWIEVYRPECVSRRGRWYRGDVGNALWVSDNGTAFSGAFTVRERIERQTFERFGKRINPHLFRDIAATSIASEIPRDVAIVTVVLGHTTPRTGERFYNQARSVVASLAYQDALERFRGRGTVIEEDV